MDFSFSENQQIIAESAADYLAKVSGTAAVRAAMETPGGFDVATWQDISSEMCWQLTHIPEAHDGLGLGYVELCILLEQMGRNLLCAPFFSTVCLGVNALLLAGTDEQKHHLLKAVAQDGTRLAMACAGPGRHWGNEAVTVEYETTSSGVLLNGVYAHVIDGQTADYIVLAARRAGTRGNQGIGLFVVAADHAGIQREALPCMDQTRRQARISCTNLELDAEATMRNVGHAGPLLEQVLSLASIGMAAEQLGVAEKVLELTVDYIKERKQFGRPVGSFQALKHKAADMLLQAESARSAVYYAACIADEALRSGPLASELHESASIARAYCSDAAFVNAAEALQMHGGAGFTWDFDVHLYLKRAKASQHYFGDGAWHRERIARILLGETA
jgi:alkylation response protein AidB-like acyl-CoA dehydrogenase